MSLDDFWFRARLTLEPGAILGRYALAGFVVGDFDDLLEPGEQVELDKAISRVRRAAADIPAGIALPRAMLIELEPALTAISRILGLRHFGTASAFRAAKQRTRSLRV